jgi:hypothetical protein
MLHLYLLAFFTQNRAKSMKAQKNLFFEQGDFGYVKNIKNQMFDMCTPKEPVSTCIIFLQKETK